MIEEKVSFGIATNAAETNDVAMGLGAATKSGFETYPVKTV
jgi:hypothetical protein